jgi:hypothetical protein
MKPGKMKIRYKMAVEKWQTGFGKKDVLLHQLTSFARKRDGKRSCASILLHSPEKRIKRFDVIETKNE